MVVCILDDTPADVAFFFFLKVFLDKLSIIVLLSSISPG